MYESGSKEPSKALEIPAVMTAFVEKIELLKVSIQDLENRLDGILKPPEPEVAINEKFVSQYRTKMAQELEVYSLMIQDIQGNVSAIIRRLEL